MENLDLTHHISKQFNQELEDLRNNVLKMGGLVEDQVKRAMKALNKGNSELGQAVVQDDHKINALEVEIDEECSRVIALRQPTASDLRLIVAVIKTITDLERIGDEAEKIGYLAAKTAVPDRSSSHYRGIKHMGRHVRDMLHRALDAFARLDADQALEVALEDREINEEYESLTRLLITLMLEDTRNIRHALDIMWAARALERIGDHAKNICEYVVYLVRGKDIRHTSLEDGDALDD